MAKVRSSLGQTYYELLGKKRKDAIPLVCLHGGPGGSHFYFKPLKALSKDRQVLMYDQIGAGRSSKIEKRKQTVKTLVQDLENLLKKLKIDRFHLLGTSWGGTLAVEYYLQAKGRGVESLILQSPLISSKVWAQDAKRLLSTLPKKEQKIIKTCLEIGATDSKVYKAAEKVFYDCYVYRGKPNLKRTAYFKRFPNPHGGELYQQMWGPSEFVATGVLKNYDREMSLSKIKVPTLFICGQYDEATPQAMRRFSSRIEKSRVEVIKNASHAILAERPVAMIAIVERFLESGL